MPDRLHIVREGEWLTSIAHRYGFPRAEDIYEYERNAPLRELRPDPSVINPGDEVWIPPCPYEVEIELPSTGGKKKMTVTAESPAKEKLEMVVRDGDGEPLMNEQYILRIGGYVSEGKTDGDGRLTEEFDVKLLSFSSYQLEIAGNVIPLEIGHLDPIETPRGLQARLNNLGYDCGEVDGEIGERTRSATRRFQKDHGLVADGVAGPKTREELAKAYEAR